MTWSRFDDRYDEHERVEDAWHAFPANPVGLHVMATTACNRWLSDGVIRPRWLAGRLPERKERESILAYMVEHSLFDLLPAGETRDLVDHDRNTIRVGPFEEDRYLVHDFLDRHDSSVQTKARRAADAERKRRGRKEESNGSPSGQTRDSASESASGPASRTRAPASLPCPALPDPEEDQAATPHRARAQEQTSGSQAETVRCPRCDSEPGEKCMGVRGPRESAHLERHHAVGELLHISPASRPGKRTAPEPPKSPAAAAAVTARAQRNAELLAHFPDEPEFAVLNAARALAANGEPATINAIRAYLEGAAA